MKYFRKHPDVVVIANYPRVTARVRKSRQTTPEQLSAIIVHTLASVLKKSKKILLLTDAPEEKSRAGFITITAWNNDKPYKVRELLYRLLYNFQTDAVCVLYHANMFHKLGTLLLMPVLLAVLRFGRKRVVLVFLTVPTVSTRPSIGKAFVYILRVMYRGLLALFASVTLEPMQLRTLKERRAAGKMLADELFPSPLENLGMKSLLRQE